MGERDRALLAALQANARLPATVPHLGGGFRHVRAQQRQRPRSAAPTACQPESTLMIAAVAPRPCKPRPSSAPQKLQQGTEHGRHGQTPACGQPKAQLVLGKQRPRPSSARAWAHVKDEPKPGCQHGRMPLDDNSCQLPATGTYAAHGASASAQIASPTQTLRQPGAASQSLCTPGSKHRAAVRPRSAPLLRSFPAGFAVSSARAAVQHRASKFQHASAGPLPGQTAARPQSPRAAQADGADDAAISTLEDSPLAQGSQEGACNAMSHSAAVCCLRHGQALPAPQCAGGGYARCEDGLHRLHKLVEVSQQQRCFERFLSILVHRIYIRLRTF